MLEILATPNHVAAFRLSEVITARDYDRMLAELESKLQQHPRIAVYAELTQAAQLTLAAVLRDVQFTLSKLGEWRRFARVALVTEKAWAMALTRVVAPFLPNIEARVFPSAERESALAWTVELEPNAPAAALRLIPTTRPDTYAFAWKGRVTRDDVDRVLGVLEAELESHIAVRLLARIEHLDGIALDALFRTALGRLKFLGLRKVERYAIVGGPAWLPRYVSFARGLSGIDVRHFPLDREHEAWTWLEAQPTSKAESAGGQAEAVTQANTRAN